MSRSRIQHNTKYFPRLPQQLNSVEVTRKLGARQGSRPLRIIGSHEKQFVLDVHQSGALARPVFSNWACAGGFWQRRSAAPDLGHRAQAFGRHCPESGANGRLCHCLGLCRTFLWLAWAIPGSSTSAGARLPTGHQAAQALRAHHQQQPRLADVPELVPQRNSEPTKCRLSRRLHVNPHRDRLLLLGGHPGRVQPQGRGLCHLAQDRHAIGAGCAAIRSSKPQASTRLHSSHRSR